jgi:hypothetical protein
MVGSPPWNFWLPAAFICLGYVKQEKVTVVSDNSSFKFVSSSQKGTVLMSILYPGSRHGHASEPLQSTLTSLATTPSTGANKMFECSIAHKKCLKCSQRACMCVEFGHDNWYVGRAGDLDRSYSNRSLHMHGFVTWTSHESGHTLSSQPWHVFLYIYLYIFRECL